MTTPRERHANTRFLMLEGDKRIWMTFQDCYRALDAGWAAYIDGGLALDVAGSGTERPLTEQERADITNAADEFSGSK